MYLRRDEMVNGYLHTDGRYIRNEKNEVVILRGWGAGNWMMTEGYLASGIPYPFGMTNFMTGKVQYNIRFDRTRTMNDAIRELCGSSYTKQFWPKYYRSYLAEADIQCMHELGYNSIRLPLDAWSLLEEEPGYVFNEETFQIIDEVVDMCEKYNIYVILDLHGAVGGQSGVSCDDGIDNVPRVFMEEESKERTIALWKYIAKRYCDRWIVAGYELLNEPISPASWHVYRPQLRAFYDETIEAIRTIDTKHIIFLQDSSFAHDICTFDESLDPNYHNWVMVFHEHGFEPEMKTIVKWLDAMMRLNVPVWYGEGSGELQNLPYFLDLLEDLGIGYNQFSWKAMENTAGRGHEANTAPMPKDWNKIIGYIAEMGPRPSYKEAQAIFDELLENVKLENCYEKRPTLHTQILKKQGCVLPAAGYDSRFKKDNNFLGRWYYGNAFHFRSEDAMKLVVRDGGSIPGIFDGSHNKKEPMNELWLELSEGEYASYTVYEITSNCTPILTLKAEEDSQLEVSGTIINISKQDTIQQINLPVLQPNPSYTLTIKALSKPVKLVNIQF